MIDEGDGNADATKGEREKRSGGGWIVTPVRGGDDTLCLLKCGAMMHTAGGDKWTTEMKSERENEQMRQTMVSLVMRAPYRATLMTLHSQWGIAPSMALGTSLFPLAYSLTHLLTYSVTHSLTLSLCPLAGGDELLLWIAVQPPSSTILRISCPCSVPAVFPLNWALHQGASQQTAWSLIDLLPMWRCLFQLAALCHSTFRTISLNGATILSSSSKSGKWVSGESYEVAQHFKGRLKQKEGLNTNRLIRNMCTTLAINSSSYLLFSIAV